MINVALILFSWECGTYNLIIDFVRKYEPFHYLASVWLTELHSQFNYCSHFKNCHPVSLIWCKQTILTKIWVKYIILLSWKQRRIIILKSIAPKLLWGSLDFFVSFFLHFYKCFIVYQHYLFLWKQIILFCSIDCTKQQLFS